MPVPCLVSGSRPKPVTLLPSNADETGLSASLFRTIEAVLGGVPNPGVLFFEKTLDQRHIILGSEFAENTDCRHPEARENILVHGKNASFRQDTGTTFACLLPFGTQLSGVLRP